MGGAGRLVAASRYPVVLDKTARKSLAKLAKPVRRRVQLALIALAANPRPPGVKTLVGQHQYLRVRGGDYRIVYTIQYSRLFVVVIDHRRGVYRCR